MAIMTITDRAKALLGEDYITFPVNLIDDDSGHGSTLSVKIVLPVWCQANCSFCFNKKNKESQVHDLINFLEKLRYRLTMLKENLPTRKITLDITGNEPTYNVKFLQQVLDIIAKFKDEQIEKVVLTTNGLNLHRFESLGPVDIVNISLHHYDFDERVKIFGTNNIPNDSELVKLCNRFNTTAVAVFDEDRLNLDRFTIDFAKWAKSIGFKNIRIRTNYLSDGKVFFNSLKGIRSQEYPGLYIKEVNIDEFNVKLYRGVEDLTNYILGAEIILDDDACFYLDYYKRYLVDQEIIKAFDSFVYIKPKEK